MPRKHTMYVIFAGPQQFGRPGTSYFAEDGKRTEIRSQAAKFYTLTEAQEFAKRMNIELTAITYIGQEDFTDFEIQRDN